MARFRRTRRARRSRTRLSGRSARAELESGTRQRTRRRRAPVLIPAAPVPSSQTANDVAGRATIGPLATWATQRLERLGADAVAAQRAALFEAQRVEKNAAISKATAGLRGTDESEEEIRAKAAAAAAAAPPPRDGYTPKDPEQLLHVFGLLPEYAWPEIADGFTSDGWRPVPGQHETGYGTLPATGKAKGTPAT